MLAPELALVLMPAWGTDIWEDVSEDDVSEDRSEVATPPAPSRTCSVASSRARGGSLSSVLSQESYRCVRPLQRRRSIALRRACGSGVALGAQGLRMRFFRAAVFGATNAGQGGPTMQCNAVAAESEPRAR